LGHLAVGTFLQEPASFYSKFEYENNLFRLQKVYFLFVCDILLIFWIRIALTQAGKHTHGWWWWWLEGKK
jgi:hypothetical protein